MPGHVKKLWIQKLKIFLGMVINIHNPSNRELRQKDLGFKAILSYTAGPYLRKPNIYMI
jgi:hypothetical protein